MLWRRAGPEVNLPHGATAGAAPAGETIDPSDAWSRVIFARDTPLGGGAT